MEKISDKLHAIIIILDKDEIKPIEQLLKLNKNKKLLLLFKTMLITLNNSVSKEQAFKKLFNKTYSKQTDYLLRNECRLLYNEIKEFLVKQELSKELKQNESFASYFFMRAIHDKKDKQLFEKEFNNLLEKSINAYDFYYAYLFCELHFFAKTTHQVHNIQNIKESAAVLEQQKKALGNFFLTNHYKDLGRYSKLLEILPEKEIDLEQKKILQATDANNKAFSTDISEYYKYLSEANFLQGKERIDVIKKASYFIARCAEKNKSFETQKRQVSYMLASLLYLQQEFEESEQLFVELINKKQNIDPFFISQLVNYYNCLLQVGKYNDVFAHMKKYEKEIASTPRVKTYIDGLLTNLYLMSGDVKHLRLSLPLSFSEMPDTFSIHYRFCYSILFFLEKDIENAKREVKNLIELLQYHKSYNEHLAVAKFIQKYIDLFDKKYLSNYKSNIKKLAGNCLVFEKDCSDNFKLFIPLKWLKKELENI